MIIPSIDQQDKAIAKIEEIEKLIKEEEKNISIIKEQKSVVVSNYLN